MNNEGYSNYLTVRPLQITSSALRNPSSTVHHSAFTPVTTINRNHLSRERMESRNVEGRTASGSNRVLLASRRRNSHHGKHIPFSKSFPLPTYLSHSTAAATFSTAPLLAEAGAVILPTAWSNEDRNALLDLESDGLGVSFGGSAKYGDRDAGSIRSNAPIPSTGIYYFEIEIVSKGQNGYIGIGFCLNSVNLSRLPGWDEGSYGYHGDDGRAFGCKGIGVPYGPTFTTGDVIGVGVDWTGINARAFYTKNGEFIGYAFEQMQGILWPSVGLRTPGEEIRANFGGSEFIYDIDAYVRGRKSVVLAAVSERVIPPSLLLPTPLPHIPAFLPPTASDRTHETMQLLVASYLAHHGYNASAEAFTKQVAEERALRCIGLDGSVTASTGTLAIGDVPMDTEMDSIRSSTPPPGIPKLRSMIRESIVTGDINNAFEILGNHFPTVFDLDEGDGGILLKIKLRIFVEKVLSMRRESVRRQGKRKMDESDGSISPSADNLEELVEMGRLIQLDYQHDKRKVVLDSLKLAFSLLAYEKPETIEGGEIGKLMSEGAREFLADQVNRAILVSASLPPIPNLEGLFRQTTVVINTLVDWGGGSAALINLNLEN